MIYPEDFKERVLSIIPASEEARKMLDSGNPNLGRILSEISCYGYTPEDIVKAYESGNIEAIYADAKKRVAIGLLYDEYKSLRDGELEDESRGRKA